MIEPHCLTSDKMLRGDRFRPLSQVGENGFVGGKKWLLWNRPERAAAVEKSGRAVNSCAASHCGQKQILVLGAVDMLRISAGNRSDALFLEGRTAFRAGRGNPVSRLVRT
jgi:hypothetical protein